MTETLLPANASDFERAIEATTAGLSDTPVPLRALWNPETCPVALLPWLAWALSVDDWASDWPEATQREVIAASVEVHRHKGTRGAILRALDAMGYGDDADLIEAWQLPRLGPIAPEGRGEPLGRDWRLGWSGAQWADYWVEIRRPITRADADALAARLRSVAPVRCRLRKISLTGVRHVLGRDVWTLGTDVPLGGVYSYEVA